jgi:hypothetical protein
MEPEVYLLCVYRSSALVITVSQTNSVHTTHSYFSLGSILILSSHIHQEYNSGLIPLDFSNKTPMQFPSLQWLLHVQPYHPPWLIIQIMCG